MKILSDRPFPAALEIVSDLRWAGADSLYLAAGRSGGLRIRIEPDWGKPEVVLPAGSRLWAAARAGASSGYVAMGAPAHTVAWKKLPAGDLKAILLDTVVDLDVFDDRLVVLGARKDERQRFAPDGAIAWVGSLSKDLADLKPVYFSASGHRWRERPSRSGLSPPRGRMRKERPCSRSIPPRLSTSKSTLRATCRGRAGSSRAWLLRCAS
jgi:hypothetical protein